MKTIAQEIIRNSAYIMLLPFMVGLTTYKKNVPPNRILIVHIVVATVITAVCAVLWNLGRNNMPFLHLYTLLEFGFLSAYYMLVYRAEKIRVAIMACVWLFSAFAVANAVFFQTIFEYNTYARGVEAFIMILYCGVGFYFLMRPQKESLPYRNSFFWINTGYFIYFSSSLFLFLLSGYLKYLGREVVLVSWAIHALVMLIMYILVSIGLWKAA
jgi:hypothetical protein